MSANLPFELIFFVIAIVGAAIQLAVQRRPRTTARVLEVVLVWQFAVAVGVSGVFAASGHLFSPNQVAQSIGWPTGSPFQRENAFGDLALGVLGILCIWIRGSFWDATAIVLAIQFFGDAYGHVYEWTAHGDTAPNNIGAPLYGDIIIPLVVIVLLFAYHVAQTQRHDGVEVVGSSQR